MACKGGSVHNHQPWEAHSRHEGHGWGLEDRKDKINMSKLRATTTKDSVRLWNSSASFSIKFGLAVAKEEKEQIKEIHR